MTAARTAADPAAVVPGTLDALAGLVRDGDVVVLSGAGMSTDSGIPDYRGATGSLRRHTPMTYQTFPAHATATFLTCAAGAAISVVALFLLVERAVALSAVPVPGPAGAEK